MIGINHGHLGFMADIPLNRMLLVLDKMLKGKYISEQRFLLEGSIIRAGETVHHAIAFNDIVISRGGGSGMIDIRVHVDGHFMYQQRSDGLIISTPTGRLPTPSLPVVRCCIRILAGLCLFRSLRIRYRTGLLSFRIPVKSLWKSWKPISRASISIPSLLPA